MENVKYDVDKIKILIDSGYPDIRRVINSAQRQVIDGVLDIDEKSVIENDYKLKLLEHLQKDDMKTLSILSVSYLLMLRSEITQTCISYCMMNLILMRGTQSRSYIDNRDISIWIHLLLIRK